jgi:membrane-bound lytic murein transglycosylase D
LNLMKTFSCRSASLALLGTFLSCAPARSQSIPKSFFAPPEPPASETPRLVPVVQVTAKMPQPEPVSARAAAAIAEAETHFQEGRKLYQAGDENGARREFDRAVDALLAAPDSGAGVRGAVERKLEQLADAIHRMDLAGLGSAETEYEPAFEKPPLEDILQLTFPVDPKLKDKVAEELRATSSQLPLELNDTILSYVNSFSSTRGHKVLVSGLRRAGRYRPMIQRILDEEGVPPELIFLAQAESGFYPRAVSPAHAMGMWQFVGAAARQWGLALTEYRDDRFDPERSTRAAARYLRLLYHRYGDWYLAIAAYNCGPGVIDKAVERTGYADFWELRRRNTMPRATTDYVPAILAMTIMVKNARDYGLENLVPDPPLEYDTVELAASTHLLLVADLTEYSVPQLRELNPALLKNVAPEGFPLRIPKGSAATLTAALDTIPAARRASWRAHRVMEGDTLGSIARRQHVREESIREANPTAAITAGEVLIIPAAAVRESVAPRSTHKRTIARKSGLASTSLKPGTHRAAPKSSTRAARSKPAAKRGSRPAAHTSSASPQRTKHVRAKH